MARRGKPRSSIREEIVTTAGNRFTKWVGRDGRTVYRDSKGHFCKASRFRGSLSSVARHETTHTLRVRQVDPDRIGPSPIQGDIAYTDSQGRWRAGKDVQDYRPDLKPGQFIDHKSVSELRIIRGEERNFFAFSSLPAHRGKTREEKVATYQEFLRRMRGLPDRAAEMEVLREFGFYQSPYTGQ